MYHGLYNLSFQTIDPTMKTLTDGKRHLVPVEAIGRWILLGTIVWKHEL